MEIIGGLKVNTSKGTSGVILSMLEGRPKGRVLDAPAGAGAISRLLAKRGHDVIAFEIDEREFAAKEVALVTGDMNRPLPFWDDFFEWYYNIWFDLKAWEISKDEGGLRNGSLEALIRNLHKEAGVILEYLGDAKHYLVKIAIQSKVKHYFNLFDSIRENGFNRSLRPPIKCTCINNLYYLKGGHHRVSVLYNLKFKNVDLKIV
jgi:SAM-dependent methyltransferase